MASKKKVAVAAVSPLSALLAHIVAFGSSGGYVQPSAELDQLVTDNKVQTGPTSDAGVAVRATQIGIDSLAPASTGTAPAFVAPAADPAKPSFAIATGYVLPESNRGGNKGKSIYPFEQLAVGQSFFIPASEKHPDPHKSLASTASSATRRFAEAVTENGQPVMETVKVKAKAASGVPGTADYEPAVPAHEAQRQKTRNTRVFKIGYAADGAIWGQPGVKGAAVLRVS